MGKITIMKPNLLISFSGGETSAYMTKWILENERDQWNEVLVVFANTSKENEQTLEFIKRCDDEFGFGTVWIEPTFDETHRDGFRVVDFETANRNGDVFESMVRAYGLSNFAWPHCTRELKTRPIRAFARTIIGGSYWTAIGIRSDEVDRVNENRIENRFIYPLVEMNVTRNNINAFWANHPWRLELKGYEGNCDLCWKKSLRSQMTIIKETPHKADWWIEMERKYGDYIPPHANRSNNDPPKSFKRNLTVEQIVKNAQLYPFKPADDYARPTPEMQTTLFGHNIDRGFGCDESCEPF